MKDTMIALIFGVAEKEGTERQFALRDLLTDLRHAADALDLDFFKAMDGSYQVYLKEKAEAKNANG